MSKFKRRVNHHARKYLINRSHWIIPSGHLRPAVVQIFISQGLSLILTRSLHPQLVFLSLVSRPTVSDFFDYAEVESFSPEFSDQFTSRLFPQYETNFSLFSAALYGFHTRYTDAGMVARIQLQVLHGGWIVV